MGKEPSAATHAMQKMVSHAQCLTAQLTYTRTYAPAHRSTLVLRPELPAHLGHIPPLTMFNVVH